MSDDHWQIRNLVNLYFDAAWRQDVETYVSTFAEDGEIVFFGVDVPDRDSDRAGDVPAPLTVSADTVLSFKGTAALREMVTTAFPKTNPLPFGHNHVIRQIGADRARGTIMVALYNGADFTLNTVAYYRDEYVRSPVGWRLQRREVHGMQKGRFPHFGAVTEEAR